ncbi:hypothetical protein FDECE_15013 [Fusarium decemcellulare]|nr:hypothetical protein FDECE_15013 [Fusarium decemcellulare]
MDSETRQNTPHAPPPMIRQPVDSYHRLIRETHGVESPPEEAGPSSAPSRSDSRRFRAISSDPGAGSQYGTVASFFDSERLASSSAQYDNRSVPPSPTWSGIRWPFLGSIRSRASRSLPSPPANAGEPSEIELPWRPFFLYRRILILFAIVFAGLIAGLQVSLQLSEQNDGLRESDDASRYLWQYGTTLVFILVAAFWTRVEFQASASMPWIRLLNNQVEVDKSLMLDYVSMVEPRAVFKAIRNKDWLVACPVTVGLLFKLVVIFSTAFITPRVVIVASHESSITLQAEFSNSLSGLEDVGSLPYFVMAALQTDNITYPNGVSPRAAYAPFVSNRTEFLEIRADVGGFIGSLDCNEAELTMDSLRYVDGDSIQINMTMSGTDCSTKQNITSTRFTSTENEDLPRTFLAFQAASCSGSTQLDQQRIAVLGGVLDLDIDQLKQSRSNTRLDGKISTSAAFLCKPNYDITTIRVSKTPEVVVSATSVNGATNSTLSEVDPWAIAQALFDTLETDDVSEADAFASSNQHYDNDALLDADEAMSAALAMRMKENGSWPELESLTDANTLKQLAEDFYQQYSALIARYAMMEPASSSTTAVASFVERRLIVRPVPAYLMTGFLGVCLFLTLATIYLAPREGFLPRDPSTLIGFASVVAHSHPLVECLKGMGPAHNEAILSRLKGSSYSSGAEGHEKLENPHLGYYHIFGGKAPPRNTLPRRFDTSTWRQPVVLHGLIRFLYIVILASIIIGFEVSLRASQRYNGLRTMDNDTAYIAWTVVPALVLLVVVAMYMIALEWWTRVLAPFSHLSRQGDFDETVGLNLADALRHVAWRRALKIRDVAAVTAILGGFIALLVVVASAPLFEPMPVERNSSIPLRTGDFFANSLASSPDDPICTDCTNDTITASLILAGNAPFPAFTFADLNLPSVTLAEDDDASDDLRISARLTAIRPNMTCRLFKSEDISTNLTLERNLDDNVVNPLRIDLEGETCGGVGRSNNSNAIIGTTRSSFAEQVGRTIQGTTLFGVGLGKTNSTSQCSDWLYVWGRLDNMNTDDASVNSIGALACNETIEAVDVNVVLHGPNLHIYPDSPPVVVNGTVEETSVAIPSLDYSSLVNISTDGLFDSFFAILNVSSFAVPESVLGSSEADDASQVQSAILQQHGIIRTQSLNFKSRRRLSSRGTFPAADGKNIISGVDPNLPVSQAVPIISGEKISEKVRLRQDPVATRILQGLVGALLLMHIISWLYTKRFRLPRKPTTIASVTALLVDGNIFRLLPRGAQWQPIKELETAFGEGDAAAQFELGWEGGRHRRSRREPRKRKEEGAFGIRAIVTEQHIPEEVELRPIPPRPDGLRPMDRVGTVHVGRARIGADSTQRKSVLVGKENSPNTGSNSKGSSQSRRKRSFTNWSGPKEMVKVWWASG